MKICYNSYGDIMEKNKHLLFKKKKKDKVLVTIHGFGVQRKHEMDDFINYYAKKRKMKVISFHMFDVSDENDNDYHQWVMIAQKKLENAFLKYDKVYLLGFSMGGVIASHLASLYPVEKLVLVSPAFIHFHLENYTNIAIQTSKRLFGTSQVKKTSIPKSFYPAFINCIKEYKNDVKNVRCPVLIIQGDDDEIIPVKSSEWAYEQIQHDQKRCVFLHSGKHRILQDIDVKDIAFVLIDSFLDDQLLAPPKENKTNMLKKIIKNVSHHVR